MRIRAGRSVPGNPLPPVAALSHKIGSPFAPNAFAIREGLHARLPHRARMRIELVDSDQDDFERPARIAKNAISAPIEIPTTPIHHGSIART